MQQEAQNTETHTRWWSNSNLRHRSVQFVSAGQLQRNESGESDGEEDDQMDADADEETTETENPSKPTEDDSYGAIFFDTTAQDIETGLPDPIIRTDATDTDESSEDEVVFTGRRNNPRPIVVETSKDELHAALLSTSRPPVIPDEQLIGQNGHLESSPPPLVAPTARQRRRRSHVEPVDTLADYIANIDQDYYAEDTPSQSHVDVHGGLDADQDPAQVEIATEKHQVRAQRLPSRTQDSRAEDAEEAQVQSSIDGKLARTMVATRDPNAEGTVLSKMYLDTEPDASPDSDDESAELSTQESDMSSEDDNELDDLDLLEELAVQYSTKSKKGNRSGQNLFPSASAFADALDADPYYGLDIMDFNRPSLQKKSKGKKPPALEDLMLSDSDLDFQIHEAWQNDRKKKKTKKKERDELRSQGLLGRNPGDADLKIKYAKGMNMEDFIIELRTFLLSPKNRSVPLIPPIELPLIASSLSLPPMTKHRRKAIHELANKVDLKSQSRGNGPTRFPVLIKTTRTPKYTRKTIPQFDHLLSGRKLNRRLFQSWGPDASRPSKVKRGGASGAAVSYMDGDVVGASAPEIGTENRGRAMLEKMGWSSGTALGASDNKGILQPVTHVVKNTRAGLG